MFSLKFYKNMSINRVLFSALTIAVLSVMVSVFMLNNSKAESPPILLSRTQSNLFSFSFANVVEHVRPSVVSVYTDKKVPISSNGIPEELFRFFNRSPNRQRPPLERNPQRPQDKEPLTRNVQTQGSGFIIDKKGYIVTNNHVVDGADKVEIRDNKGKLYTAKIIGTDPSSDLAVLQVKFDKPPATVEFANSNDVRVGDWVVAIGNPFGLGGTVTAGIVSAIGRDTQFGGTLANDYIQIDASINRGNSGGPSFNLSGKVVGVNTAIFSPSGASAGIGFAISSETTKRIVTQLIENGEVVRGWLGVSIQSLSSEIAKALSLNNEEGALVADVLKDTPAEKAGLLAGDIVTHIDAMKVKNAKNLTSIIEKIAPDTVISLKILRPNKNNKLTKKTIKVKLAKRTLESEQATKDKNTRNKQVNEIEKIGLTILALSAKVKEQFRLPEDQIGVIVSSVKPGSAAEKARLTRGDILLTIDGVKIYKISDFVSTLEKAVKSDKEVVLVHILTKGRKGFSAIELK